MPPTASKAVYGTTIKWNGQAIAEILAIGEPGFTNDLIDVTNFTSPDHIKEFIAGYAEGDEMTFEMNFVPSDVNGQIAFITDAKAGTRREIVITGPSNLFTWTFLAIPRSFKPSFGMKDQLKGTATVKIVSSPTLGYTLATGPTALVITGSVTGAIAPTPVYADDAYEYIADGSGDVSVTVTVTAAGADSITVNGSTVATGVASSAITLVEDGLTTITVVVAEDNKVSQTYVFMIGGPPSS